MMTPPIRRTVMAVTTCAAGLSLTACSAGITFASPFPVGRTASAAGAPASGPPASPSPSPSVGSADNVTIDSPLRTFPIPPGAQVITNITCAKETIIEMGEVTVAKVASFYNSVLPADGYQITGNSMIDTSGIGLLVPAAEIQFTGHGYNGTISALSNFITIDLIPPGAAGCPAQAP